MELVYIFLAFFFGVATGLGIWKGKERITDGSLLVDTSSDEKDIYRLEVKDHLETLAKKNGITLKVVHRPISQSKLTL